MNYPSGRLVTYTLDALGNRSSTVDKPFSGTSASVGYSYNAFNQLTSMTNSATSFAYDGNGNLGTETWGANVKTYVYDLDNRLRLLTLPGTLANSFEYDANGLRTKKIDSAGTTRYLLDGPSVVAEYDEVGNRKAFYVNNPQRIDEVFSASVLFNGQPTKVYPLVDGLGSVYALADKSGNFVRTNAYDVYGSRTSTGAGPQLSMGFTGREHDSSGLNYHRDRYMSPGLGMWTQVDRLGTMNSDSFNLYQYAGGSPVNNSDPSGLSMAYNPLLVEAIYVTMFATFATYYFSTVAAAEGAPFDFDNTLQKVITAIMATIATMTVIGQGRWLCYSQCNVQQYNQNQNTCCPDRVTGVARGPSEEAACREAKRAATQSTPSGCYSRHCKCTCYKT